jgi:tetratricopeptide (TPR) repeat protein
MKRSILFLVTIISSILIFSCGHSDEKELESQNLRADSLSIKLNSPELKAVNAELLKDPSNAELYNKRAKVYLSLRQLPEALSDTKRAIKLDSTKAGYFLTMADVHFSQNNTRLSKELLEQTAKRFPDNTEALLKLSELYFLVQDYQAAIDFVNKALKIDETIAKGYYIKGSIYRESGDTGRAVSNLETATEQDNNYFDAFYDLGVMYAARRNPLALDYYNNALRLDPTNEEAGYARAKFLQDLGKMDEAIKSYELVASQHSDCERCYYNLGAIHLEVKKDPKKALGYFTKAIEIEPNYADAYFARGYTYVKLNDKASAKADYNMCIKIRPDYTAAIVQLREL